MNTDDTGGVLDSNHGVRPMDSRLPFIMQVRPPISRAGIIIFAVCMLIVDLFLYALISLESYNRNMDWWYLLLLAPVALFFIGLFFIYEYHCKISLDEAGLIFEGSGPVNKVAYSDIVNIRCTSYGDASELNATVSLTLMMVIESAHSSPLIFNPLSFTNKELASFLQIIHDKNPRVTFDKYASQLQLGNSQLTVHAMRKNVIISLLISLALIGLGLLSSH